MDVVLAAAGLLVIPYMVINLLGRCVVPDVIVCIDGIVCIVMYLVATTLIVLYDIVSLICRVVRSQIRIAVIAGDLDPETCVICNVIST